MRFFGVGLVLINFFVPLLVKSSRDPSVSIVALFFFWQLLTIELRLFWATLLIWILLPVFIQGCENGWILPGSGSDLRKNMDLDHMFYYYYDYIKKPCIVSHESHDPGSYCSPWGRIDLATDVQVAELGRSGQLMFGTVDTWLLWNLTGGTKVILSLFAVFIFYFFLYSDFHWDMIDKINNHLFHIAIRLYFFILSFLFIKLF